MIKNLFLVAIRNFKGPAWPALKKDFPQTALVAPDSLVLTQSSAEKYFGKNTSVVGKSLQDSKGDVYKITGV